MVTYFDSFADHLDFSLFSWYPRPHCDMMISTMIRIDGKAIAQQLRASIAKQVQELHAQGMVVSLAVILVGNDKPSHSYVKQKELAAKECGIVFTRYEFPETITQQALLKEITNIQQQAPSGLIVQLPLPAHIDTQQILNAIDPDRDVDCLTDIQMQRLAQGDLRLLPPTPGAICSILEALGMSFTNKTVAIFGHGVLVGKPMALIARHQGARVFVIDSTTDHPEKISTQADIIISGVGKKHLINAGMVKKDAIIIDAGVDYDENGNMYGDVDIESVAALAAYVTPTPGGVGPVTVARLLLNTLHCGKQRQKKSG